MHGALREPVLGAAELCQMFGNVGGASFFE
jgi:hypothetical protein